MNQAPRPNHFIVVSPCKKLNTDFCLLFLHEALGSIGQWKSFPQQLCDLLGADGIVYERQGHGESKPMAQKRDASYLHKAAYEELETFIDQNLWNWAMETVYLPARADVKNSISEDVQTIASYDPRILVENVIVTEYEHGLQLELELRFVTSNQVSELILKFDRETARVAAAKMYKESAGGSPVFGN